MSTLREAAENELTQEQAERIAAKIVDLDAEFDQYLINAYDMAEALARADAVAYGSK